MQHWFDDYFLYVFPFFFVALWLFVTYLIALAGGWRLLAQRFRSQGPFAGWKRRMRSARMRGTVQYNNVLTIGADVSGLFIVPMFLFRAWHPALLIPWMEVTVRGSTRILFFRYVELRLGRSENIPLWISASLASELEAAAGSNWPPEQVRDPLLSEPPPIG